MSELPLSAGIICFAQGEFPQQFVRLSGNAVIREGECQSILSTPLSPGGTQSLVGARGGLRRNLKYVFAFGSPPQIQAALHVAQGDAEGNGSRTKTLGSDNEDPYCSYSTVASDNVTRMIGTHSTRTSVAADDWDCGFNLTSPGCTHSLSLESAELIPSPPDPLRPLDSLGRIDDDARCETPVLGLPAADPSCTRRAAVPTSIPLGSSAVESLQCDEVLPSGDLNIMGTFLCEIDKQHTLLALDDANNIGAFHSSSHDTLSYSKSQFSNRCENSLRTLRQSTTRTRDSVHKWTRDLKRTAGVYTDGVLLRPGRDCRGVMTQPSRFCHICLRRAERVALIACAKLRNGTCRKVVCEKCFSEYEWDFEVAAKAGSGWTCTHCRQVCPSRAQCFIYKRTNARRHQALLKKKFVGRVSKKQVSKQQ